MDAVNHQSLLTIFQLVVCRVPADLSLHNVNHRMSGY